MERRLRLRAGARSASRAARSRPRCSSRRCLAAFEMDEILYELRDHSAGLNCGRWDYIFSFIKKLSEPTRASCCPTAAQVTMDQRRSCARTRSCSIKTCHRRGVHAMGGMAAQIPIKDDAGGERGGARQGARRQAARGRATATTAPGSRTPGSSPLARGRSSTTHMPAPNQLDRQRATTCRSTAADLLRRPAGHASPRPGCARTSASACSTSRPGCAGRAACRSTT